MDQTGYLTVAVTAARGNFPLEGARVRVYSTEAKGIELLATMTTDISGQTDKLPLSAPPFSASQSPDSNVTPYSLYTIETDLEGYYTVQNIRAPIFSGITSVQRVAMIPRGEVRPSEDTRFNESSIPML